MLESVKSPVADEHHRASADENVAVQWWRSRALLVVAAVATGLTFVTPLTYVLSQPFADGGAGVRAFLNSRDLGEVIFTTAALTIGAVVIAMIAGTAMAWWSIALPRRSRWLSFVPMIPIVLPQLALVLGFSFLMSPSTGFLNALLRPLLGMGPEVMGPFDVNTVPWMIFILGITLACFVYMFVRTALANISQDVIDSAATSGFAPTAVFFRVVLPLLRPALIFSAMTVFLLGLGQFTVPLILGRQSDIRVLTTKMYGELSTFPQDFPLAASYALPILAAGLLFIAFQRFALRDQRRYEMAGSKGGGRPLRSTGILGQACLLAYGLLTAVLPLIALVIVSMQPYWNGQIDVTTWSLASFQEIFARPDLLLGVTNSILFALGAVAIAIPIGHICARVIHKRAHYPVLANLQDLIISLPLGIPGVVFGVGFLIAFVYSPVTLYGNPLGVILLYVTLTITYSVRMQLTGLAGIGDTYGEAAASSGAGAFRRLFAIELPMLKPALGSAAALVFVITSHEFTASLFVRAPNTNVMGTVLYDLWNYGSYPVTAAMAILMCVISGIGVWIAIRIGGSGALGNVA